VLHLGFAPVVPPNPNRLHPWTYDRRLYRRRNEIERLFRRLKGFRRIFSRFEKLDLMFTAFIHFALIVDMLCVNTPSSRGTTPRLVPEKCQPPASRHPIRDRIADAPSTASIGGHSQEQPFRALPKGAALDHLDWRMCTSRPVRKLIGGKVPGLTASPS
jgi:hypothetical protein